MPINPVERMSQYVAGMKAAQEYQALELTSADLIGLDSLEFDGRTEKLTQQTFGISSADLVLDQPKFTLHKVGRMFQSHTFGNTFYLEVPGCMYRCVYCYVNPHNLTGDIESNRHTQYRAEPKNNQGSPELSGRSVFTPSELIELIGRKQQRSGKPIDAVAIGSGEPLTNFAAIARLGTLLKESKLGPIIEIDTTGFPLIINPDLIKQFSGHAGAPGMINFYLSMFKGRNAEEHERVTQSDGLFWDAGPKIAKWLLANKFWVVPGGIATPLYAHPNPQDLKRIDDTRYVRENRVGERYFTDQYYQLLADESARSLANSIRSVHPLFGALLRTHRVTCGNNVENPIAQQRMMRNSGFIIESKKLIDSKGKPKLLVNTRPGVFETALKHEFQDTPVINEPPTMKSVRYCRIMQRIINDLSKQKKQIRQELIDYRRMAYRRREHSVCNDRP